MAIHANGYDQCMHARSGWLGKYASAREHVCRTIITIFSTPVSSKSQSNCSRRPGKKLNFRKWIIEMKGKNGIRERVSGRALCTVSHWHSMHAVRGHTNNSNWKQTNKRLEREHRAPIKATVLSQNEPKNIIKNCMPDSSGPINICSSPNLARRIGEQIAAAMNSSSLTRCTTLSSRQAAKGFIGSVEQCFHWFDCKLILPIYGQQCHISKLNLKCTQLLILCHPEGERALVEQAELAEWILMIYPASKARPGTSQPSCWLPPHTNHLEQLDFWLAPLSCSFAPFPFGVWWVLARQASMDWQFNPID